MAKIDIKTTKPVVPMIYAYTTPEIKRHDGWTKIGYTEQDVDKRLNQQTHTADVEYKEEWRGKAEFDDGSGDTFTDHDFHRYMVRNSIERLEKTEWFHIQPEPSKNMFYDFRENRGVLEQQEDTTMTYQLRDEQNKAVEKAIDYFKTHEGGEFLWNCKPRFGKTLSVYDLAKRIEARRVLVVTNRPAIANSWYEDFCKFAREEYYFATNTPALQSKKYTVSPDSELIKASPFIEFESLQDLKGSIYLGGKYDKYKKIVNTNWDLLVIDEAHEGVDTYKTDVAFDHIKRKYTLHLSGTPFKALANDKFDEKAIFNWTYADEQKRKANWGKEHTDSTDQNPYKNLPQLNMFTYQMSEMVKGIIKEGIAIGDEVEEYAFDLNEFFATDENTKRFIHEPAVNKFLNSLTTLEKYPFSTPELRNELKHTVWLLDRVDSAKALARKLKDHEVFKDYEIVLAAGDGSLDDEKAAGKAYDNVVKAIANHDKTITLTVGQLTTGITIPEWTAVLMLSNVSSPSLYMQAAFRAQNPCLFHEGSICYRKENAYVFDFDPARTLTIYEKFANDLSSDTSDGRGSVEQREDHIKELLNFFPVIGEDSEGKMIELDAASVLSIPRKIRSTEVVKRGFMSNFLFQNISNIFSAPNVVRDILEKFTPVEEPSKKEIPVNSDTAGELGIDETGEVHISATTIDQEVENIFGDKLYSITDSLHSVIDQISVIQTTKTEEDKAMEELKKAFVNKVTEPLISEAKTNYGKDLPSNEQKRIERTIQADVSRNVEKAFGDYQIQKNVIEAERNKALNHAESDQEVKAINKEAEEKHKIAENSFKEQLRDVADETVKDTGKTIVEKVETHKRNVEKQAIEEGVRDHLRGFTRTIPSFLMAYGNNSTSLSNFDSIIPANVFKEVTSITLEEFRFLRDGGNYVDPETGETKYYEGHLFDEVVFNDSVKEFLNLKHKLANYFDKTQEGDIFDYIPPQKTNQIFTPKKVVKEMVDLLEQENPGCFDDDTKTFADLYMKSGLYITEIVTRLYNSERMKELHPDDAERLNHIFAKQVYGLAPTEIIYRVARSFILGFSEDIHIEKDNLKLCDSLIYAKEGTLEEKLIELFS
ncbi:MAG: DEAD/DEAH box helicase family protein [Bulleidia sp.]|nr:DEAD/DEAH box helicase family protein [Bulleidia sp.]